MSNANAPVRPIGARLRTFSLAIAVAAAITSAVVVAEPSSVATAAAGALSGTVFQDYDSDGVMDVAVGFGIATDSGVKGIQVRAFASDGTLVGSTTTAANGTWSINVISAPTTDVRVEFAIPDTDPILGAFESSFATTTSAAGSTRGTSVQFAQLGNSGINYAINVPGEFCQNNPNLSVSRQCWGTDPTTLSAPTVWVSRYNGGTYTPANGYSNVYPSWPDTRAGNASLTGSIYGMTWNPISRKVISAAFIRRGVPLYESGGLPRPGALFSTAPDSTTYTTPALLGGTTSFLVDLETLMPGDQFSNTTAPASGVANAGFTGYIPTNAARGLTNLSTAIDADVAAVGNGVYEEVGKAGIGDIDIDEDGNLWVVSLYTRHLYKVPMPANGTAPTEMTDAGLITTPIACANGQGRPFAATFYRDAMYLGVVCDGSASYNPGAPMSATDSAFISMSIVRFRPSDGSFSKFVGPIALHKNGQPFKGSPTSAASFEMDVWNPWTDAFTSAWLTPGSPFLAHPMPILTDLQFDRDGSIIVGMRDRAGDQSIGRLAKFPNGLDNPNIGIASGDIYRLCRTGAGWTSTDYTFQGGAGCANKFNNFTAGTTDDEWYVDDYGVDWGYHADQASGSLEQVPGFTDVVATGFDAFQSSTDLGIATYDAGGISWYVNTTGARNTAVNSGGGVNFYTADGGVPNSLGSFQKNSGMSDVEALCDSAPVQIGNRLWRDTDGDGVQDPGEPALAGVTVHLYNAAGVLVGTAVTNAKGEYLFSSTLNEVANGGATPDAFGGGLVARQPFTIRLDNPTDYSTGALAGLTATVPGATTTAADDQETAIDSNGAVTGGNDYGTNRFLSMDVTPVLPGVNDHTYDLGVVPLVGISNRAWVDTDGDGVQDEGEPGLAGVKVELFQADGITPVLDVNGNPAQAVTDVNGNYVIDGVVAGTYRALFTAPHDYALTTDGAGTTATDSNPVRLTGLTPPFSVAASVTGDTVADTSPTTDAIYVNPTIDAGFRPMVSVGDFVWLDLDRDGRQDAGEPGIEGVTLTLTDLDGNPVNDIFGNPVGTTTTDADGHYLFANLPTGQYKVAVTTPTGYTPTRAGEGADNQDSSTGTATSNDLTTAGAIDSTLDFGFVTPSVWVGDFVWFDTDGDGRQDPGEPGIEGVTLTLTDLDGNSVNDVFGNPVGPTTTDADGKYLFENLPTGRYKVLVTTPTGYLPTTEGVGNDQGDSSTGSATSKNLPNDGDSDTTLDFGFTAPRVSVGDYVWFDWDRDGVQDAGEPGIEGVTLTLTDLDGNPVKDVFGNPVDPTTTDADGNYLFADLPVGQYKVTVTPPDGFLPTQTGAGTSTTDSSTGSAESVELTTDGASDTSLDFGFIAPAVSVGDYVWLDRNRDGVQDVGEAGIDNVTLTITNADGSPVFDIFGNPVTTTTTDADGHYRFDDLPPGAYRVTITPPAGLLPTLSNSGAGETDSSTDAAMSTDLPNDGDADLTLDFGFVEPMVSVGDYVWSDTDRDGLQDLSEAGIEGVTLTLTDLDGNSVNDAYGNPVGPTTTDAYGHYSFDNLPIGQYKVTVATPAGFLPTTQGVGGSDTDSSTGTATSDDLTTDGANDPTLDFGFFPIEVAVGDFVWFDTDHDGVQDVGEPPLSGVVLTLTDADGNPVFDVFGNPVTTTSTDADGNYLFEHLPPGTYKVTASTPAGMQPTVAGVGSPATDSSTGSATSGELTTDGEVDPTLDFGFWAPPAIVGSRVWSDLDGDGIQDPGEPGIPGVVLRLTTVDGTPVTDVNSHPVGNVTTDANGDYLFKDLPLGQTYKVTVVSAPTGYITSPEHEGADTAVDSSTGTATSSAMSVFNLSDLTLDFGFVPMVSVGNRVWIDYDHDGAQDTGEPGIANVELTITTADGKPVVDVDGNPVTTTRTDADGFFSFDRLPAGQYKVTITDPPGYVPTLAGRTYAALDASVGDATSQVLTDGGARDDTLDFGFVYPSVSVGDFVWLDDNRNGIQDPGESGLAGVTLRITTADGLPVHDVYGNLVTTTTTNSQGYYQFASLPFGSYTVTVTPPSGFLTTTPGIGSGDLDSSTGSATSVELTVDGECDPTLDFGFVPTGDLPATGGSPVLLAIAALLMFAGFALLTARRRRPSPGAGIAG